MARETKEERQERLQREVAAADIAMSAYRASIPNRMMLAQAIAASIGVNTEITLTPDGPAVHFHGIDDLDETISYTTDEWELEYLEERLRTKKEEQEARARRRGIAEDVWKNKLTVEEKLH